MIHAYRIESAQLMEISPELADILIISKPTDTEKEVLGKEFALDPLDVEAIFDPDEVPRIESSRDSTLLIWKCPDDISRGDTIQFGVSSLGIAIRQNKAAVIVPRNSLVMTGRDFKYVNSLWECILHTLMYTVHRYQGHLKAIKLMSQELQAKIVTSMENKYLLQMFALGESLVYYHNALESNFVVLSKLRAGSDKLKLTVAEIDLLDDIIIENQQASKQASIYSTVLSGLMDARGTIINNNMNVLLKNLTLINVVFLPLNLIASIGGMSEYSAITHGINWHVSYGIFSLAMLAIGWVTWWWLVKILERNQNRKQKDIS
jgi:magnesium transporter